MAERVVSTQITDEERTIEPVLRPQTLEEYVGQERMKESLRICIEAAKQRNEALDHTIFYGPPGLGKTTIAHIIAREMGASLRSTSGLVLAHAGDLAAILTNLQEHDVLFIDEIHRLPASVEEALYPAMEDYQLDLVIGQGPAARTVKLDLPRFTLVGATTRAGNFLRTFGVDRNPEHPGRACHDRLQFRWRIEFQPVDEAKSVTKWGSQGAGPGRRSNQRKPGKVQFHCSGCRTLPDHQIELIVLHRWIKRLLNRGGKAVNFVNEQDVMLLEICQDGGQIACMGQHETGGRAERSPHLTSNDMGNGGLPQPRGAIKNRVIERFVPLLRRLDTDPQGFFHPFLANILLQGLRT